MSPDLQGSRIAVREGFHPCKLQPCLFGLFGNGGRGKQHAAGENVTLDEIHLAAIIGKKRFGNGDGLHGREPTRFQPIMNGAEIRRPVTFPHRLDHFDRSHLVILALRIAVIANFKFGPIGKPQPFHARARESQLLL